MLYIALATARSNLEFPRKAPLNGAAESIPAHFQAVADFPCAASLNNLQRWLIELIKKIDKGSYIGLQDDSTY